MPWSVSDRSGSIKILDITGKIIASIYKEDNGTANADLIAVSPEMYDELKKLYDGLVSIANSKHCPVNINNRIIDLTYNTLSLLTKANKS